ncbi:hypothetical protein B0H19DRAFT_1154896 [Mycena capillaripes]|nr:hypothetical protein B0H19DRAFT_1154896 [Mycena capillaripes]
MTHVACKQRPSQALASPLNVRLGTISTAGALDTHSPPGALGHLAARGRVRVGGQDHSVRHKARQPAEAQ